MGIICVNVAAIRRKPPVVLVREPETQDVTGWLSISWPSEKDHAMFLGQFIGLTRIQASRSFSTIDRPCSVTGQVLPVVAAIVTEDNTITITILSCSP